MKKLIFITTLLSVIFLLIGCSAQEVDPSEISIYHDLSFDWSSMTFTNTQQEDIFYQVGNPYDDFAILHQEVTGEPFTVSEANAYQNLLNILEELSELSNVDIGVIISYTSAELKDELQDYSIALTLDLVVTFNSLKLFIEDIKVEMNQPIFHISKIEYIEKRLSEEISEDDFLSLEMLQEFNISLSYYDSSIRMSELSFEELLNAYENMGVVPSEDMIPLLESGHQLIQRLKNS